MVMRSLAFAKSLAFATGSPVVGVPTLEVIGRVLWGERPVVCVRDARRSALYYQEFAADGGAGPLRLVRLEDLPDLLPADALVTGDAVGRFGYLLSGDGRELAPEDQWECPALGVAELGAEIFRRRGGDDVHDLSPIYLRVSEAEERFGLSR